MIEQDTFKRHLVGRDGFQWWIGQVVDETAWIRNTASTNADTNNTLDGVGARFKVRIMGYHTASKTDLPDEDLPWATVLYPTTAGAGGRNHSQSVMISQGSFVFGFFLDGENAQQPVIMGCMGFNDYQEVMKNVPDAIFKPFSGYGPDQTVGPGGEKKVPGGLTLQQSQNIASNQSLASGTTGSIQDAAVTAGQILGQSNGAAGGGEPINRLRTESATDNLSDKASARAIEEPETPLYSPEKCEKLPINTLHKQVRNAIQEVERLRRTLYDLSASAQAGIGDLENKINKALERATQFISASMKNVYNNVMQFSLKTVNEAVKPLLTFIPLDKRTAAESIAIEANNVLLCGFKNLIGTLMGSIGGFLRNTVQHTVNAPSCFIANFVANFLGAARGVIGGVAGALQGSLGSIADAAMGAVNIVSDVMGLVDNVFNFLSCETDPECSTLTEWSILGGQATLGASDLQDIITRANGLAQNITDIPGNIADSFSSASNVDLNSMFNDPNCNTDAEECGPPTVTFVNASGQRALANLVIGDLGEIIGVDMLSFGVGYSQDTRALVNSNCGNGNGAVIRANVAGVTTATPPASLIATAGDDATAGGTGTAGAAQQPNSVPVTTTGIIGDIANGSRNITNVTSTSGDINNILPGTSISFATGISTISGVGVTVTVISKTGNTLIVDNEFANTQSEVPFTFNNGTSREGQIMSVTVIDPGTGYLPSPDGSRGGDGRVWANANDTTIKRKGEPPFDEDRGVWEIPIPPGWNCRVGTGDRVQLPPGTRVITEPNQEEILGGSSHLVNSSGTFTSPDPRDFDTARGVFPSDGSGAYPVVLSLCELIVENSGVNYTDGDEIVIAPNMGAEAVAQFDRFGRLIGAKVTNPGEGFRTYPKIYIKSDSGYNAELIPRFCIDRIGTDKIQEVGKEKVLDVVDCVGRLPDYLTVPCKSCNDTSMVW